MAEDTLTPIDIQESLNLILAIKDVDPKIAEAWNLYLKKDYAGSRQALLASDFFRNNNEIARQRQIAAKNQPEAAAKLYEDFKLTTKKRLIASGVQWNDTVEAQVKAGYLSGIGSDAIDQLVIKAGGIAKLGGSTGGTVSSLKSYAESFGVQNLYTSNYWTDKGQKLFSGDTTEEDIKSEIRELSASTCPAYSTQIKNGTTLDSLAGSYKASYAKLMGVDVDTVSYDNPRIRQALQKVDPKTGQPMIVPIYQFEKELRSTPEWEMSPDGVNTYNSLAYKVLNDWGMA
jgi:hypothetical protein